MSRSEFIKLFSNAQQVGNLFHYKRAKHLQITATSFSFLLKRVAEFEYIPSKETSENWVQYDSTSKTFFQSAIRFEFLSETNSITIHMETDTNQFMELFLERKLTNLISAVSDNIKAL